MANCRAEISFLSQRVKQGWAWPHARHTAVIEEQYLYSVTGICPCTFDHCFFFDERACFRTSMKGHAFEPLLTCNSVEIWMNILVCRDTS